MKNKIWGLTIILIVIISIFIITFIFIRNCNKTDNEIITQDGSKNNFSFTIEKSKENKKTLVLTPNDTNNINYNIYYYGINNIKINFVDDVIDLKQAVISDKISLDEIINKNSNSTSTEAYKDGGSIRFFYKGCCFIKLKTIDGQEDLYIGNLDMTMEDII